MICVAMSTVTPDEHGDPMDERKLVGEGSYISVGVGANVSFVSCHIVFP